ncbi:MAG: 50S ribosomal protein L24e [Promethearchaeota archaeon]
MVKKYTCTFCGTDVEPGTGSVFVKNDGTLFYLCSSKCRRNQLILKRTARRLKWTEVYEERIRRRSQATKRKKAKSKPKAKAKVKKETKAPAKKKAAPKSKSKKETKAPSEKPAKKSKPKSKSKKE